MYSLDEVKRVDPEVAQAIVNEQERAVYEWSFLQSLLRTLSL